MLPRDYTLAAEYPFAALVRRTWSLAIAAIVGAMFLIGWLATDPRAPLRLIEIVGFVGGGFLLLRAGLAYLRQKAQGGLALSKTELAVGEPFSVVDPAGLRGTRATLICRESAAHRGSQDVHEWIVREARADEGELRMRVPWDAMHSFRSANHEISWRVEVRRHKGKFDLPLRVIPAVHEG